MRKNLQKGQVLIEALVALSAAVIIIGVIVTVVVTSLNNSELAKNQNLATQYAQQGMETIRELTETNWTVFKDSSGWYCLYANSNSLESDKDSLSASEQNSCKWDNAIFNRRVNIEWGAYASDCNTDSNGNVKVTVIVAWNDSKCKDSTNLYCHKVQVNSCFSNVKGVQAI